MFKRIAVVIGVFCAGFCCAAGSVTMLTTDFQVVETDGQMELKWVGELTNESVGAETVSPFVMLLDAKGEVLDEFPLEEVTVGRFGKMQKEAVFRVDGTVWDQVDTIAERVESNEQVAMLDKEVEIYTISNCGWCAKAKDWLRANRVSFVEYNIKRDKEARRRLKKDYGVNSFPFLVVGEDSLLGYSKDAYNDLFEVE